MNRDNAVAFDLDGVLLDSERLEDGAWIDRAFSKIFRDLSVPDTPAARKRIGVQSVKDGLEPFCEEFGLRPGVVWSVREKYILQEKVRALRTGEIGPFDDVSAVRSLSESYPLFVVSNSPQAVVDVFLDQYDLRPYFQCAIGRGSRLKDLYLTKPEPHLLEKLLTPERTTSRFLYVGDSRTDLQAARAVGMDFLRLDRGRADGAPEHQQSVRDIHSLCRKLAMGLIFN